MQTVLISVKDGYADIWAKNYIEVYTKRQTQTKVVNPGDSIELIAPRYNVMMKNAPTADDVIKTVKEAVGKAKAGGTLVFNVGHGAVEKGSSNSTDGWVDISPNGSFKLGGLNISNAYVKVFYDFVIPRADSIIKPKSDLDNDKESYPNSENLKRWAKYQEICKAIKEGQLRKVVFLTCNIGNAVDFLKKISLDFNTPCQAYKRKVQLTPQTNNNVRVHLQGDPDGKGTNIADNEKELMIGINAGDVVLVGPPR